MSLANLINELNPQQKQAATTETKHSLVLAGAGCGKTKTIVARAAYLIDQGIPANQIQILTFTRRSASEIVARVELALGDQAKGLRASTFHTFCMYLLRRVPKAFGLDQFSIIDRDDQLMLFRLIRGKDDKKNPNALPKPQQLCDLYSFARNTRQKLSLALEKQLPEFLDDKDQIAEIMKEYETRKRARSFLDYDDILAVVASALAQSDGLADYVAGLCQYMLVDEMQDTNRAQIRLLSRLLECGVELTFVGDVSQSIYGFRGSSPELLTKFAKDNDANVCHLTRQYRASKQLLMLTNFVRQFTGTDSRSLLVQPNSDGTPPHICHVDRFDDVLEPIGTFLKKHQIADTLILVRTNSMVKKLRAALKRLLEPEHVITMHKAKGLECQNCIVIDPRFSGKVMDTKEEFNRLIYTAVTRPKDNLMLINSLSNTHYYKDGNDHEDINILDVLSNLEGVIQSL